jgi:hypothetical protein
VLGKRSAYDVAAPQMMEVSLVSLLIRARQRTDHALVCCGTGDIGKDRALKTGFATKMSL